jgi:beta-galactosidase
MTDRMGFIVMDEIFDTWEFNKTDNDFHLIFPDWHEPDLRAFIRRDRNHPSIIAWSYGNEVAEQTTNETGAALSRYLKEIVAEEDPSRLSTASVNAVGPEYLFPGTLDIISLNYRGAGIRDLNPYSALNGTRTHPQYSDFHSAYPEKMIWSTESSDTLSTRGTFIFPVVSTSLGAPVNDSSGGNEAQMIVSDSGLYTSDFGQSPDRSFLEQDKNPYVAGEFVWTGWDYIGEPTPYYTARSSYSGIIDLAGFKKDRFYEYQAHWRPDLEMAHLLPHWNWPERVGMVTPVHVFTSGDEAELFVNGKSQGRNARGQFEYRIRWDEVVYHPGEISVVAFKNGKHWANATRRTTDEASRLRMTADRNAIDFDGRDLSFLTVEIVDERGDVVPTAQNTVSFSVSGPGEIVGTDNGFPGDFTPFPSTERDAFNGLALAVIKAKPGSQGTITVSAHAVGLHDGEVTLHRVR